MLVAVCGCAHGQFREIYDRVLSQEPRPELLLICGDVQAIRNAKDMNSMSAPAKYLEMGEFQFYAKQGPPILTIVIGGNHEASAHFMELPYGGWLAPNMYYLGLAGCVLYRGLRIAGLSGIYYEPDYLSARNEKKSLRGDDKYSVYHVRKREVDRLSALNGEIDLMLSHDWPAGIEQHGDVAELIKKKRFLAKDIHAKKLGSPPGMELLRLLKPKRWFSAHMHCLFTATVEHSLGETTEFKALSKVGHWDSYLTFLDITPSLQLSGQQPHEKQSIELDPDWARELKRNIFGREPKSPKTPLAIPQFGPQQTDKLLELLELW